MENTNLLGQKNITAKERKLMRRVISDALDETLGCDDGASRAHWRQGQTLAQLNNFGLGMLSIHGAAELIVCDMWAAGVIEVEALENFEGSFLAPEIKAALHETISVFVTRLTNAVEMGRLRTERVARDFHENLILAETFVEIRALEEWLNERGYYSDEAFLEWRNDEAEINERIIDELIWLRSVKRNARGPMLPIGLTGNHGLDDEPSQSDLMAAYRSAVLENQHLRERLANAESRAMVKPEQSASPRHRRTLLTLIGALCDAAGLDVGKRGVAQQIVKMTEQVGAPVDDETIRKVMADIPDAIESRNK